MPYINSTEFGSITIENIKYDQVLIIGEKVHEREYEKLKREFGTTHKIGNWELEELLSENPKVIVIGTGQDGILEVDEKIIDFIKNKKIRLIIEKTPQAIITYNKNKSEGKKVNAIIHTTC